MMQLSLSRRRLQVLGAAAVACGATVALAAPALVTSALADTTNGFNAGPVRLIDTRNGSGTNALPAGMVNGLVKVQVPDDVASSDADLLSITIVNPTAMGYITAYTDGSVAPHTSDVNWTPGATKAQSVLVAPSAQGYVDLNVVGGPINLVVDSIGAFPSATATALPPSSDNRILDTRNGNGSSGVVGPTNRNITVTIPLTGTGSIPAGATGVAITVAQIGAQGAGYVSVVPAGAPTGTTSSINYAKGTIASNMVWVPITDTDRQIVFSVKGAATNVFADLKAYTSTGSALMSQAPARVADSRNSTGGITGLQSGTVTISPNNPNGVPAGATYAVLNIGVVGKSVSGYVAFEQAAAGMQQTSSLNYANSATVAGLVIVPIVNGKPTFYLAGSPVNVFVDLEGYITNAGETPGVANHANGAKTAKK